MEMKEDQYGSQWETQSMKVTIQEVRKAANSNGNNFTKAGARSYLYSLERKGLAFDLGDGQWIILMDEVQSEYGANWMNDLQDTENMENKTERTLPESQSKIPDEDKNNEDTELLTMERAEELSKQYEDIKDRTIDKDTVLGRITDLNTSQNNDRIIISIDLPGEGADKDFRFRKPKVWHERYDFVRWIRHYDYDADSFPNMLENHCKVKVYMEDGEYELFIPEWEGRPGKSRWGMIPSWSDLSNAKHNAILAYGKVGIPISWLPTFGVVLYGIAGATNVISATDNLLQFGGIIVISIIILLVLIKAEEKTIEYINEVYKYK